MMKALIIDDEPIAQDILVNFSQKIPFITVQGIADNAIEGLEKIAEIKPDLIFLDIQMPELTGVQLLRSLVKRSAKVIITTAYRNYAIEGYELDVVDYLVKPIPFDRFVKAVNKAYRDYALAKNTFHRAGDTIFIDDNQTHIWVKEGKKMVQLATSDIIFAEAMADYVNLILADRRITVHSTMLRMQELLAPPDFIRVSRSVIIRLSAIRSIENLQIETMLAGQDRISIGAKYWDNLKTNITLWTK